MKKIICFLLVVLPFTTWSQKKISEISTPSSPASSLLGMQPTITLAPKSYQALETALFSNFSDDDGNPIVPNDFALEFTPYWTKNHSLSLMEYLYPENGLDQFCRNSSFSIASTKNFLLGDSSSTNAISFGYRTSFYLFNKNEKDSTSRSIEKIMTNQSIRKSIALYVEELTLNDKVKDEEELLEAIRAKLNVELLRTNDKLNRDEVASLTNEIILLLPDFKLDDTDPLIDSLYSLIQEKINAGKVLEEFNEYLKERPGLSVDIAYAGMLNFPGNQFEFSYVPKQSLWITPVYRFKNQLNFLKVSLVARYEWYNLHYYKKYFDNVTMYENNFDLGVAATGEWGKFSLSFEGVSRKSNSEIPAGFDAAGNELYRKEQKSDLQYTGTFSYNLSDQVVLSYTLGNRFEPILNPTETLISLLSMSFGLGGPDEKDVRLK